eukprot:6358076-Prymnesium_polylepis.1
MGQDGAGCRQALHQLHVRAVDGGGGIPPPQGRAAAGAGDLAEPDASRTRADTERRDVDAQRGRDSGAGLSAGNGSGAGGNGARLDLAAAVGHRPPQAKGDAPVEAADVGRPGDRGAEGLGGSERISRPVGGIRPV